MTRSRIATAALPSAGSRSSGARAERSLAHARIDPFPGTNGGLRWNGTRFSQSLSACQWMRPITCIGIAG